MSNPNKKSKFNLLGVSPKGPEIENKDTVEMLILIGKIFCIVGGALPLLNLLIWILDSDIYMKITPLKVGMNPLTATLLTIVSGTIWLIRHEKTKPGLQLRLSRIISIITFVIGSFYFLEIFFDDFKIKNPDQEREVYKFIFGEKKYLNLMAPNTAISIALLSISVFLIEAESKKLFRLSQLLSYAVLFLSLLYIYGYAYQIEGLYKFEHEYPMAFFTAASLFILASSITFLRPHKGAMAVIVGQSPTEVILLRLLAFIIPLCIGYLKIKGTEKGYYSSELGTAIFAAITFLISMSLLGWKSSIQHKLRKTKKIAFDKIKQERERFFKVLNCSPTNILLTDYKNDHLIFINDMARHQFNLDIKNVDTRNFKKNFVHVLNSKIHKDDRDKLLNQQKRIEEGKLNRGYFDELEYRLVNDDDTVRWMYSRTTPFKTVGDKIITALSNGIDITKQKAKANELEDLVREKESELMKTQDKLHFLTRHLFQGVFHYKLDNIDSIDIDQNSEAIEQLIGEHFFVDKVNMEGVRLFGFDAKSEIEGLKLKDMINFGNFKKYKVIKTLIENDYKIYDMDVIFTQKDGNEVKLKTSVIGIVKDNKLIEAWSTVEPL